VTGFGLGDQSLTPAKERNFALCQRVQTASTDYPASCQIVAGVKHPGREAGQCVELYLQLTVRFYGVVLNQERDNDAFINTIAV
jgi:hypothetical protein